MGLLIDASVLIEHERGRLDLSAYLSGVEEEEFFLSVITVSELLHGVHRAPDPAVRSRRAAWVDAVLERFPLLPVDVASARAHARIWAGLAAEGQIIGHHDLWLAATCVAHDLRMATADVREFQRVPGLQVLAWEEH